MWFIKNLVFHIWVTFREIPADEWAIGEKVLAPIRNSIWLGWFSSFTSFASEEHQEALEVLKKAGEELNVNGH